ncbi:MAG: hypothetical protein L0H23_08340, partial [Luteimonas sp.]|nr:hypothetical protein [Luteimonas sp.]
MTADVLFLVLAALMLAWGLLYTFTVVRRRLASMPEHRGTRPVLRLLVLPLLGMGLSIGLLLSTAGAAVCPGLLGVAAPLTCQGRFQIRSRGYAYAPGVEGSEASAWCVREPGELGESITTAATLWS